MFVISMVSGKPNFENVLFVRIELKGTKVWRRILVPEISTFWDLHVAIQDSMGWTDSHLHEFRIHPKGKKEFVRIGIPSEDDLGFGWIVLPGFEEIVTDHLSMNGLKNMFYVYDFGDGWIHEVILEGIHTREKGKRYPICIDGEKQCPPEDCGGVWGYHEILEILERGPRNEDERETMEWLGKYDPDEFYPEKVKFTDPMKRLKTIYPEFHEMIK